MEELREARGLTEAEAIAERMKDEYISVEHIMLGILEKPSDSMKRIFKKSLKP